MSARTVGIGGASAMWGDSAISTPQLLADDRVRYLVYDFLAETTMAILARMRERSPEAGYATDFVSPLLERHLDAILDRGIRVIANAGGLNPIGCCRAIEKLAAARGRTVRVAAVTGDDVSALAPELRREHVRGQDGEPMPEALLSANAYLGARPIVDALQRGAQIVVTGRCVDSALVLAPLVHEFGWDWSDYDRLAQGTLAGHIVECGAQATGGLFTDWETVPGWDDIGYPILECSEDASFVVTKAKGTGGLVIPAAVAEQVVYEIGDPAAYLMPDVVCDLRDVRVEAAGDDRVRVRGARGRPPTPSLKVCATYRNGHQIEILMAIRGRSAPQKARRTAEALLPRTRRQMSEAGFADYSGVAVELLGCESQYGPHARALDTREVVLRLAAQHADAKALEFLRREAPSAGTSMGPGTRGHFGGRADVKPVVSLFSFLLPKSRVSPQVHVGDESFPSPFGDETGDGPAPAPSSPPAATRLAPESLPATSAAPSEPPSRSGWTSVPLAALAYARSGDKGNSWNIGVVARRPELYDLLRSSLTADRVAARFAHLAPGPVERYELRGLHALNFVLHGSPGGMAGLRSDPLGKSYAQILLDMDLPVPPEIARAAAVQQHASAPGRPAPKTPRA